MLISMFSFGWDHDDAKTGIERSAAYPDSFRARPMLLTAESGQQRKYTKHKTPRLKLLSSYFAGSFAEALPVVLWADALQPRKASPHRLFRAEAATHRNPLDRKTGLHEQLAHRLDT